MTFKTIEDFVIKPCLIIISGILLLLNFKISNFDFVNNFIKDVQIKWLVNLTTNQLLVNAIYILIAKSVRFIRKLYIEFLIVEVKLKNKSEKIYFQHQDDRIFVDMIIKGKVKGNQNNELHLILNPSYEIALLNEKDERNAIRRPNQKLIVVDLGLLFLGNDGEFEVRELNFVFSPSGLTENIDTTFKVRAVTKRGRKVLRFKTKKINVGMGK